MFNKGWIYVLVITKLDICMAVMRYWNYVFNFFFHLINLYLLYTTNKKYVDTKHKLANS